MKLFWKINVGISITVFLLFNVYILEMILNIHLSLFLEIFGLIFIYGPFWEVVQIPLCLIITLLTLRKQTKIVWVYFFMMAVFFLYKICWYVLILGSIVPRNMP